MADRLRFVYAADLQPGSPCSFRYNAAWFENWLTVRQQIISARPEFLVLGGDITRDGFYHDFEFREMKSSLDSMEIPYYAIPGNMDIGNKSSRVHGAIEERDDRLLNVLPERFSAFEKIFGSANWTFIHGDLRVSGFCDILLGSGLPEERKVRDFLSSLAEMPRSRYHLILMHYAMFINSPAEDDYDITKKEEYSDWYFSVSKETRGYLLKCFKESGVTRVLTAHMHCRREVYSDGITFDFAPSTTFGQNGGRWKDGDDTPGFYLFEFIGGSLIKTFIPTTPLSAQKDGFGKGGHVTRDRIDYSESKAYREKTKKTYNCEIT